MIKKWLQDILSKKESVAYREWKTENSILKFLSDNMDSEGNLSDRVYDLPDEKKDDNSVRFAPGLMDAMFGAEESEESVERILRLTKHLKIISNNGNKISEREFYHLITENTEVIRIIDKFLQIIVHDSLPIEPFLFPFAKNLTTKTDKRNAVKFGIAILGLCQNKSVLNDLKILGLHDEFTVYVTIAIINLSDDPVSDLWDMAKKVEGWGKIQLVDRLATMELNQRIKEWLILDGYKNNIMHEYLALTCATHGLLHEKLEGEKIDKKLFKSSADIILALISPDGPTQGISGYIYASSVIENFIRHARLYTSDISDFITLHKIKDFLSGLQNDIEEHKQNAWNQDIISNCLIEIVEILNSRDWKELTQEGLKSKDQVTYREAKQSAEKLGIDLWETVWTKLQEDPIDHCAWYDATYYGKPEQADQIIDFALKHLPLDEFATGPKDSMGIGPSYSRFMCFDTVITYLENYPQRGEEIILAGLKSPITRNRNMTINVLNKWKRENWSTEIVKEIESLREIEPNQNTRENIQRLLNGQELQ